VNLKKSNVFRDETIDIANIEYYENIMSIVNILDINGYIRLQLMQKAHLTQGLFSTLQERIYL